MDESPLDDRTLAARAAEGDRAAFGLLYERHVRDVYRYVRTRVGDAALAEDLTHDVFVNAWRAMPRFTWASGVRPWLLRSAHNRVANHWRTHSRKPPASPLPEEGAALAAGLGDDGRVEDAERRMEMQRLEAMLARLTDAQREVLALRFGQQLNVAETAELMGRSRSAVKNLQHSAIQRIKALARRARTAAEDSADRARAAATARDPGGAQADGARGAPTASTDAVEPAPGTGRMREAGDR